MLFGVSFYADHESGVRFEIFRFKHGLNTEKTVSENPEIPVFWRNNDEITIERRMKRAFWGKFLRWTRIRRQIFTKHAENARKKAFTL